MSSRFTMACLLAVFTGLSPSAGSADVAQSTVASGIRFDWSSHVQHADESDNFHMTWHPNGSLFAPWGDGWGFEGNSGQKRSIGVSEIRGTPTAPNAIDVFEGDPWGGKVEAWDAKSWGIVAVGTDLYMWVSPGSPQKVMFREARLARSTDNGRSWTKAGWAFTARDRIILPSFMQLGPGYTSPGLEPAITDYLYSFSPRMHQNGSKSQRPGMVDLMRVPKDRPLERAAYEFFAGLDAAGRPQWSRSPAARRPVLQKAYHSWAPPSVSYNPHLGRFLMAMAHVTTKSAVAKGLGVYEAEAPWGPWRRIVETKLFAEGTIFFAQFPTKWMDPDGRGMWMAFTGTDKTGGREWDALNVMRVTLETASKRQRPGPD